MTSYVLIALACGGLAWLASLYFGMQRRVADLEKLVNEQRTSAELVQLRESVAEMIVELRRAAAASGEQLVPRAEGLDQDKQGSIAGAFSPANDGQLEERGGLDPQVRWPVSARAICEPTGQKGEDLPAARLVADQRIPEEARRETVLRLAREGLSGREIAKITQMELGGVELLLRLGTKGVSSPAYEARDATIAYSTARKEGSRR